MGEAFQNSATRVSSVRILQRSEIINVLELQDLISPAGPAGLEVASKQLQAFHTWPGKLSQNCCERGKKEGNNSDKGTNNNSNQTKPPLCCQRMKNQMIH